MEKYQLVSSREPRSPEELVTDVSPSASHALLQMYWESQHELGTSAGLNGPYKALSALCGDLAEASAPS